MFDRYPNIMKDNPAEGFKGMRRWGLSTTSFWGFRAPSSPALSGWRAFAKLYLRLFHAADRVQP